MPYPRQNSNTWFLKRRPYRLHMLCELSAVFLTGYTVLMVLLIAKVHAGGQAFKQYVDTLRSPIALGFHAVALLFALLHAVTWFRAVPVALPPRRGEQKVPGWFVIGAAYASMLLVTAAILVLVLV